MGSSTPLDPSTPTDPHEVPFHPATIAESLRIPAYDGFTLIDTFAGQLFLETVNRTDTNFTFFSVGKMVKLFDGIDPSILGMYVSESWIGHIVSMTVFVTNQLDIAHVVSNAIMN
jgi:hypothetical protein